MSQEITPITQEFLLKVKKYGLYHSYGEFDGFRDPSLQELMILKGLLEGAIYEKGGESNTLINKDDEEENPYGKW
ncbi:hypothetical protein GW796_07580 [archaeon]|nr:hypothetical protein [archaeon]